MNSLRFHSIPSPGALERMLSQNKPLRNATRNWLPGGSPVVGYHTGTQQTMKRTRPSCKLWMTRHTRKLETEITLIGVHRWNKFIFNFSQNKDVLSGEIFFSNWFLQVKLQFEQVFFFSPHIKLTCLTQILIAQKSKVKTNMFLSQ